MKKLWRILLVWLKWIVLALVFLELFCFLIITVANFLILGHPWEGSRVDYDAYAIFLNVEGVQPTWGNPPLPATGTFGQKPCRLWLLGGSTMRGGWVKDEETIPSHLAGLLNRPGSPEQVMVTNYGENSFNSLLETKYLQKLLLEAAEPPDLVIFYDGANDCSYFNQYRTSQGHYGYRSLRGLIESNRRSYFSLLKPLNAALYASFTREVYDKLRQTVLSLDPEDSALAAMSAAAEKRYEHVSRLSAAYGAKFLLVWQPFLWVETGEVAPAVKAQEQELTVMGARFLKVRHNFAVTYNALAGHLKDKPYFVDLRNALCSRTAPVYEADGVHLKPVGNKMVAQALARVLAQRGW